MDQSGALTYGEYLAEWKRRSVIKNGKLEFDDRKAPKRMPKDEATSYYTAKLRAAWEELGYKETKMKPVVIEPDSLQELQKKAENDVYMVKGSKGLKEYFAKKGVKVRISYEEAAKMLGKKDARAIAGLMRQGIVEADPKTRTVDYESLKRYMKEKGIDPGWVPQDDESVKQKGPETKGFKVEEEPAAQTTVKEMLDLLPDWESDDIDLSRYAKDTRGTITLGALMEFGKACIEAHEKRKGLKAVAFEVAREVA